MSIILRAPKAKTKRKKRAADPVVDTASLRDRILDASIELISQEGLQALSMREVARRAGVTHQAPYHHFADREAILAAIAEQGFTELNRRIAESSTTATSAVDALEKCGMAYVSFALEKPAHFRMMFRPELVAIEKYPALQHCADSAFGNLPMMVEACAKAGLVVKPNTDAFVVMLWSFVHGFACLLLDGPLERTVPASATHRTEILHQVTHAFRSLIEQAIDSANAKKAARATKSRPSTKRG